MAPESLRILLIEDDSDIGLSLSKGLELEGYDTSWQTTGADGIADAQRLPPHLVILDVQLPDLGTPTKAALEEAMADHILASAELIGTYERAS